MSTRPAFGKVLLIIEVKSGDILSSELDAMDIRFKYIGRTTV